MATQDIQENNLQKSGWAKRLRELALSKEGVLFIIMILAILGISTQSNVFLTQSNILNQGRLITEIALIALPMTYIIITGGIDLSVGSIAGLSAIMLGYSWDTWGLPLELAIVVALAVSTLAGFINGLIIVRLEVPPLITTLATLALYRGMALGISESRSVRGYPDWFLRLGDGSFLGIPNQLWILIIAIVITAVILSRTTFGRSLYAIGNNEVAARFSGIPVGRYKLIIYTLSGFMAGLSGYILVSRVTTTRSDMGSGWELDAIAAVVLGGTSIFGGSGSIIGTVIGFILIQLLKNGLSLMGVTGDATIVVIGLVLIFAILVNNLIQHQAEKA